VTVVEERTTVAAVPDGSSPLSVPHPATAAQTANPSTQVNPLHDQSVILGAYARMGDPESSSGGGTRRVTYVGHATVLLEIDGMRVLTDPVLRDRVAHLRRHAEPPVVDSYRDPDLVLISHGHADHLDPASLRLLGRDRTVVVPRGLGRLLRRRGFSDLHELGAGETVELGPLAITGVPAIHDGRRIPIGPRVRALGYLIEGGVSAYFAGDTDLFDEMEEIAGGLDLALLPVAGWGPRVGAGHLDPERASRAVATLRPRVAVPIHWGTLAVKGRRGPDPIASALEFEELVRIRAPEVKVRVLRPGHSAPIDAGG
jgi:L-ascorbate metabolism protein UlaG (beta-lactamase superfamily)